VVKVDAHEELAPIRELRETMVRLGLSLSAFAVVAGAFFGFTISRPIRELAQVARRIGKGEHELRAPSGGSDEVGLLARTFNAMADELVRTHPGVEDARDQVERERRAADARRGGHAR
jgi:nitrogen fixation/metabolism regulation signal transduction histidine kinase